MWHWKKYYKKLIGIFNSIVLLNLFLFVCSRSRHVVRTLCLLYPLVSLVSATTPQRPAAQSAGGPQSLPDTESRTFFQFLPQSNKLHKFVWSHWNRFSFANHNSQYWEKNMIVNIWFSLWLHWNSFAADMKPQRHASMAQAGWQMQTKSTTRRSRVTPGDRCGARGEINA